MTNPKLTRGPSKGEALPEGVPKPLFRLTPAERKWWDWLLAEVDREFVGTADLAALGFLARELAEAVKAKRPAPPKLRAQLDGFGLTPVGRKKLVRRGDVEGGAVAPVAAGGYDEFE